MGENKKPRPKELELLRISELYKSFNTIFLDLEAVWHALLSIALAHGLICCRRCQFTEFQRITKTRHGICLQCGLRQSLTARTFLSNVRVPRAWLFAKWLSSQGYVCSYNLFHEVVHISASSAGHIYKSLGLAVDYVDNENAMEVESLLFNEIICHRSCETPKRKHPKAEEEFFGKYEYSVEDNTAAASENSLYHFNDTSQAPERCNGEAEASMLKSLFGQLSEAEHRIANLLSTTPVHMDKLVSKSEMLFPVVASSLTMLEIGGLAQRLPGDFYVLCQASNNGCNDQSMSMRELSPELMRKIKSFCSIAMDKFSGFSRKDLQLHLNNYWLAIDRQIWSLENILLTCFKAGYLGSRMIKKHVTKLLVRFPLSENIALKIH